MTVRHMAATAATAIALGCQAAPEGTVAFVNVSVLPMDREHVLEDQTVVVSEGRIAAVGPTSDLSPPRGAEVVDGRSRFLMPGFTEMHGHLPGRDTASEEVDRILFLFLSNGVTTVRGMIGEPFHLELRQQVADGIRAGPTLLVAGPPFRATEGQTAEAARKRVREQKAAGYDLLKILEGLSVDVYDSITEEVEQVGIPFGGHVPNNVGLLHALAAGQGSIDHLDNYLEALVADDSPVRQTDESTRSRELGLHLDESKLPALVEATRLADASAVPTMALWETFNADLPVENYLSIEGIEYLPKSMVNGWAASQKARRERLNPESGARIIEMRKRVLKALQAGGARIVFGTDAPQIFSVPGFSIHREMRVMTEAGLTPFEVLASGTRNAAEHFGSDEFGIVEVGRRGDLLLLEANPLDDVANMARRAGVMVRGRWMAEREIQARLSSLAVE